MDGHFFDDLAKGLDDGSITRRRALKLVGAALLSSALMPLFPRQAHASKAKRKCLHKGGTWLTSTDPVSPCHCAQTCSSTSTFGTLHCHSSANCICLETVEGKGFCSGNGECGSGCSSNADCSGCTLPPGSKLVPRCVVIPDSVTCGAHKCFATADCFNSFGAGYACITGICQKTICTVGPCP